MNAFATVLFITFFLKNHLAVFLILGLVSFSRRSRWKLLPSCAHTTISQEYTQLNFLKCTGGSWCVCMQKRRRQYNSHEWAFRTNTLLKKRKDWEWKKMDLVFSFFHSRFTLNPTFAHFSSAFKLRLSVRHAVKRKNGKINGSDFSLKIFLAISSKKNILKSNSQANFFFYPFIIFVSKLEARPISYLSLWLPRNSLGTVVHVCIYLSKRRHTHVDQVIK